NPAYSKQVITSSTPYVSSPPYQSGLSDQDASKTRSVANPYLKQAYRVTSIEIVSEYNLNVLNSNRNDTSITLITCYPFDSIAPKPSLRYVVKAKKI
ncbi:MAG: LPXTG-site transpeptidase (sortase) family protein, partial [Granulosicoccus sp.]